MACSIPANPDISGIGVRVAIYAQNILSFVPALYALLNDGEVDSRELEVIEDQSTTILVTAFAILISTIIQARTQGLTGFDTSVILNLSWMNNTNTFIYFIMYVHHLTGMDKVKPLWSSWVQHAKERLSSKRKVPSPTSGLVNVKEDDQADQGNQSIDAPDPSGTRVVSELEKHEQVNGPNETGSKDETNTESTTRALSIVVATLGSLHLTLMAAVGIWLWSSPAGFESSQSQLASSGHPYECTFISLLGHSIRLDSRELQGWSLMMYILFLFPVFNLFIPAASFLALYIGSHCWYSDTQQGRRKARVRSVIIGLSVLLAVNVVFLIDTELTISGVRGERDTDSVWTFGQTLALLLLALPIRDTALLESYRRDMKRRRTLELQNALFQGDTSKALGLLERKQGDVNVIAHGGQYPTALHMAVMKQDVPLVQNLLERNVSPNATDEHGVTPLHCAARSGSRPLTLLLLRHKANPNSRSSQDGQTALHYAINAGSKPVTQLLLRHRCNLEGADNEGSTPLLHAVKAGSEPIVQILLQQHSNPNVVDKNKRAPLHYATKACSQPITQLLLDHKSDPNALDDRGWTSLHHAARAGSEPMVQMLLKRGSNPNVVGKCGWTPLHGAARAGSDQIVTLLLGLGADVNAVDVDGSTPLHCSARAGSDAVAQVLLKHGADSNAINKRGWTPLHFAAQIGSAPVAQVLLTHNANPKAVTKRGWTPLYYAAQADSEPVAQILLGLGTDPNTFDMDGKTPLYYAQMHGLRDMSQLLSNYTVRPPSREIHWSLNTGSLVRRTSLMGFRPQREHQ